MSTSVMGAEIGAFEHSAATLLVSTTVSTSERQDKAWGICLMSHSMGKLVFEPRSVCSICYIPLCLQRDSDPQKPTV